MKAVILGNTKLNYSWFIKTTRQGLQLNEVKTFDIDYKSNSLQAIKKRILDLKPDLVFTHLSFHANVHQPVNCMQMFKEIKNKIDVKIIHTCQDARTFDRYTGDLRGIFDAAFVGTHAMVENMQPKFKIPTFYINYSSLTYPRMAEFKPDLAFNVPVFTGSPNAHHDRRKFIADLQKIMKIKIFKTQSHEDLRKRTPELSVSAKCILGLCTGYDIPGFIDVRPFQYLGTGAFMIMRKFKGMDEVIPDDLYIPFNSYKDPYTVKQLWNEWKNKDTTEIRKKAFDYIQSYHSSKVRMAEVLDIIRSL